MTVDERHVATEHVQPTGAVAGYRPERTLRLSVELRRQFKRRRTIGVFALMVALPLILIGALQLGGERRRAGRTAGSTWSTSPRRAG